mmetsp:Transcript_10543/g.19157  ORF Transcript_10543/g.19157 Transcript_10543/m.19157 type:complete len:623 (-) Transcript_10543:142-2010(-)|eukprot:CAMPEP_0196144782 /NCGR_PEP_ID=MMETSP0910-20130528/17847_1 /TAXON_ID=49265 /ORGANISM="Thalassiosira rotula, Strain GSO102" /LENGTH=622 /DNA_ID=CAMNT_0041406527 /DNA_START=25 /DNA_END=1893 /DNA_ORIENTATION=+
MDSTTKKFAIPSPSSARAPASSASVEQGGVRSILAAVMGLASLGVPPVSPGPRNSSSNSLSSEIDINDKKALVNRGNMHTSCNSNANGNGEIIMQSHATPKKLPEGVGVGLPPAPNDLSSASATGFSDDDMVADRFYVGQPFCAMNRANTAISISAPARPHLPCYAYQDSTAASLSSIVSLSKLPDPYQIEPIISTLNFPETLMQIMSSEAFNGIISWLPHGRGFVILDRERFTSTILPRYFDGARFTSFTRRLKRWSFVRVPSGPELGAYYNKKFVRDQPELVQDMRYETCRNIGERQRKKKQSEILKRQAENEKVAETKAQESLLKRDHALLNKHPSRPTNQDKCKKRQLQYIASANIKSPKTNTCFVANPQDRPMPLPSSLPKKPKSATASKNIRETVGSHVKNAKEAATIRKNMRYMENHIDMVESSCFQRERQNCVTFNDPLERRMMEIQHEMTLVEPMPSHEFAGNVATPGPRNMGGVSFKANADWDITNHTYNLSTITSQTIINNELAKCTLEAQRDLEHHHRSHMITGNDDLHSTASKILSSPKIDEDVLNALVYDWRARLKPSFHRSMEHYPQRSFSQSTTENMISASRPIMMSREDEEGFARYLFLKRSHLS